MQAVVISVGSELIDGFLTDTNATFLAQEMVGLGIELVGVFQVGDTMPRIIRALQRGWEDADLLITTGGIGPTDDDLTREAIAEMLGQSLRVDSGLVATIQASFAARGLPMPEQNRKQAWLIPSATPLPNPIGTAPGWFVRHKERFIVAMPGVPREMRRMWHEQVVPRLNTSLGDRVVVSRTLKAIGIGESAAEQQILDVIRRGSPRVATYAKNDGLHIRITAVSDSRAVADGAVTQAEREVRAVLGQYIYGDYQASLTEALLAPLETSGQTLATSEVGTEGRIASLFAQDTGAESQYAGGLVGSFDRAASGHGIDPASADATRHVAMLEAVAVRSILHADVGMAVAVRITPDASADQCHGEVALYLTGTGLHREQRHDLTTARSEIRRRARLWAVEFLRVALNPNDLSLD